MNRIQGAFEDGAARSTGGEFFVVSGESSTWYVSTPMARFIEQCLDADPRPKWVRFVDLTGARIRLRTRQIDYICQCTPDQRAAERAFFRSLKQERKSDSSYGENDC
jgi:hypothetical protein